MNLPLSLLAALVIAPAFGLAQPATEVLRISSPADGASYLTVSPITVSAEAAALPVGAITNVQFLVNDQSFGNDSTAPFSAQWTAVVPGVHRFSAVGTADTGNAFTSAPVMIAVARRLVASGASWKYLDNGSDQGTAWFVPGFDDSAWKEGPSPLGYGDANGVWPATTNSFGPNSANKYLTTYYRKSISITNAATYTNFAIRLQRDDGVLVYLNGTEIFRQNMPAGAVNYLTLASTAIATSGELNWYSTSIDPLLVQEGPNVLAAELHQSDPGSSDIWFNLELLGVPVIPRNQAPVLALTAPALNEYFLAPASVTLAANATDADGTVSRVEFFVDGSPVGSAIASPFSFVWNAPSLGWHVVHAVATDDQGATTVSAQIPFTIHDSVGTPLVQVTSPASGSTFVGPTNLPLAAIATGIGGITNVLFLANGSEIGSVAASLFDIVWNNASFGTNELVAVAYDAQGLPGTSAVVTVTIDTPPVNTIAPTVFQVTPPAGSAISNLTVVQVTFSEGVVGVDAADLLVNGVPALGVIGSGSNYTFTVTPPPLGSVAMTWAADAAITDTGWPSTLPFDPQGAAASWGYDVIDMVPPVITAADPVPGASLTNLSQLTVTFSEPVAGLDAADLLVNGTPATNLVGADTTYSFDFAQPPSGTVTMSWAAAHGITDRAALPNPFNSTAPSAIWTYNLDTRIVLVQSNATWRFLKAFAEASSPMDAWRFRTFDDSSWSNAPAPFFYGDTGYTNDMNPGTSLPDMLGSYSSIYLRHDFMVDRPAALTNLYLVAQSDDGFIAWINGVEVVRYNMGAGEIPYNGSAPVSITEPTGNGARAMGYTLTNASSYLLAGTNLLVVHAFNNQPLSSSDFGFNAQLYTYPPPPLTPEPRVTLTAPADAASYLAPVDITLTASALDEDGQVAQVEFFANGARVGGAATAPYAFTWANVPPGNHLLTAVATDNSGLSATSAPVRITVEPAGTSMGLFFDGVDDYVTFSNAAPLRLGTFTLETWFKWNGTGVAASSGSGGVMGYPLIAKGRGESDGNDRDANYFFGIQPLTNVLVADLEEGLTGASPGLNHPVFGTIPVTSNVWHHAALTFDGTSWRIILDGVLDTNVFVGQPPRADSLQHASLGTALDSLGRRQGAFGGVLDEARAWNLALDVSVIASNRYERIENAPGLVARWGMDEPSGDIVFDSVGGGAHGLLVNGTQRVKGYPFAQPPTITLAQPASGSSFSAPATIVLTAETADVDGFVTNVAYFANGAALGNSATTPFSLDWLATSPGLYVLTAVATDDSGLTATSTPVEIVVENPAVRITAPAHRSRWAEPADIEITAQLSEPLAATASTEFYANNVRIGQAAAAPFRFDWMAVPAGAYELFAVALDGGILHTSAPVQILVVSNHPPSVVLTAPASGSTFEAGSDVLLESSPTDPDGVISAVQFFSGTNLFAEVTQPPFVLLLPNLEPGAYSVQAAAWDDLGAWAWSEVISFTVVTNTPPVIVGVQPAELLVPELTAIRIQFSEPVSGVDAADLLVNGLPATSLVGLGSDYTFGFPQPPYGPVNIAWAADHSITDLGPRPLGFDHQAPGATWAYSLVDQYPPRIHTRAPEPDAVVTSLTNVQVLFSEPVLNVDVADLLINGQPAVALTATETNFVFEFPQPPFGPVQFTWAPAHGITDFGSNSFDALELGANWSCILSNTAAPLVVDRIPSPSGPGARRMDYVFVISVDGLRADLLREYVASDPGRFAAFARLVNEGAFTFNARPDYNITVTMPNHCSMMTGLPILQQPGWAPELHHGVTDNSSTTIIIHQWNPAVTYIPSAFDVAHDYGWSTASYVSKSKLSIFERSYNATWGAPDTIGEDNGPDKVDTAVTVDGSSAPLIASLLDAPPRQFTFMHFAEPDAAGHGSGWGSATWSNAVATINGYLAAVLNLVETNDIYRGRTAILLTADHGGIGTDHSQASNPAVYTIPFMVWGAGLPAGADLYQFMANRVDPGTNRISYVDPQQPIRNGDLGNMGLALLGLPPIPNSVMQPQLAPAGGRTNVLTSVAIAFSKPVINVDAGDLLVNGVPASNVTGDGTLFTFTFPQPPFGTVTFSWVPGHGIADAANPDNAFDTSAATETWQIELYQQDPPTLASIDPVPGSLVGGLTSVNVTFNEPVRGVHASDLLVNGVPATAVSGSGTTYNFTFPQPLPGTVQFTWAESHGIEDLGVPTLAFAGTGSGETWAYEFRDSTPPVIVSRTPAPGANVGSLTTAQVVFSEPVEGVTADDLLINGTPAISLTGTSTSYEFGFPEPAPGLVTFAWANGHGITDRAAPPNTFDSTALNAGWTCTFAVGPVTLLATGSVWKYLDNGSNQGIAWRAPAFDDSSWASGPAELGYGDDVEGRPEATVVSFGPNASSKYVTTYFRRTFVVANPALYEALAVDLLRDDGGVVYINGVEVYRNNMPATAITYTTFANNGTSGETTYFRGSVSPGVLVPGTNVIAVEIHQASASSSDLSFDLALIADVLELPAPPVNLVAQLLGTNEIQLVWADTATNEAGFIVEHSLDGSNWVRHLNLPADTTTALDSGLRPGTTHYYRVLAFNAAGESLFSNPAAASIPGGSAPAAPVRLLAAALSTNTMQLAWTDLATNESGFRLERSTDGTNFSLLGLVAANTTNVMDIGLLAGTSYFYRVLAFNTGGDSDYSNIAGSTTVPMAPPPVAPGQLLAMADNGRQYFRSQLFLNWRDRSTNESGFLIERSLDGGIFQPLTTVPAGQQHYVDRGLESATHYFYRVRAVNAGGGSEASNMAAEQTHPQSQFGVAGESVTFHAGVEGVPPMRYQWRFEGYAIPGETNQNLTLSNLMVWDEGGYSVAITDVNGRTVSNPAWLFVLSPPVVATQPGNSTNTLGSTATFSVAVAGPQPMWFQWRKDGIFLEGANEPTLVLTNVQISDYGFFDVVVENDFGAVTSQLAQLVFNLAPVAAPDTVVSIWGESLRIQASQLLANDSDPEGTPVRFHHVAARSARGGWVESRDGGYILYLPPDASGQPDSFTYAITDAHGGLGTGTVSVTFTPNTSPVFVALPPLDLAFDEGEFVSFNVHGMDAEAPPQKLTYGFRSTPPAAASLDPATGSFRWQTTEADSPGIYPVAIDIWDDGIPSLTNSVTITITVRELSAPPTLVKITDASVVEGETVQFTAVATDTDVPAQTLTFSLDPGAPNGAAIDPLTGLFSWTTTETDGPGVYTMRVRVTDSASPAGTSMQEIAITVTEANQAPVLVALTDHTIAERTTLYFTAGAADSDLPKQILTYSLAPGAPAGAAIDSATGQFTWTPTQLQGGTTNAFTIVVADDGVPGSAAVQSFTVIVRDTEPDFLMSAGSTNVFAGQTSAVPLTLLSDLELSTVSFTLETDHTRLTNLVLHPVSTEVETVEFHEVGSNKFTVSIILDPSRRVAADRVLANLAFEAVPATNSAVVAVCLSEPLAMLGELALRDGGVIGGQVTIINQQPVLTIQRASVPRLTLYGKPGISYRVESTSDLASGIWTTVTEVQLTNPSITMDVDLTQAHLFYRVREL